MSKFDANKSRVSENKLAEFISSPLSEDLTQVPGIGPSAVEKLSKIKIHTTYQLIGVFLTLKDRDMSCEQHLDAFWLFLEDTGINAYRSGITHSIASKVDVMIPGIYNQFD